MKKTYLASFRKSTICPGHAQKTKIAGSQMKGKCVTQVLAGSLMIWRNGVGAAVTPVIKVTINTSAIETFHICITRWSRRLAKGARRIAVTPATRSQLLPLQIMVGYVMPS